MTDQSDELLEAPFTCEDTTEYDNGIEDSFEIEPEEEQEDVNSRRNWGEVEQRFAQFERSYRVRRIRELTMAPIKRKRGRPPKKVAA